MTHKTLAQWLDWQSTLNPKTIDLGLDRIRRVWGLLGSPRPAVKVISVAGTNGKGSSVAMLEAILLEAGYRVGCFTSPHLQRYNERIRVNGREADDAAICAVFERIEQVRSEIPLTYFEFGTLAALLLFAQNDLDVAVLEVGLGGRLDAVNLIDADVAMITAIGLDHTDWLGDTLDQIGVEKAGIMRQGRPVVFGAPDMPESISKVAYATGARLLRAGRDFRFVQSGESWQWQGAASRRNALPIPAMRGAVQLQNAAAVLQVLECLADDQPVDQKAVRGGLLAARLRGRFEVHQRRCRWVLDVGHNPQAVAQLSSQLGDLFVPGKVHAVVGMLRDKAVHEVFATIAHRIDKWHLVDLSQEHRGASAVELRDSLPGSTGPSEVEACAPLSDCLSKLDESLGEEDLVLVFGSFLTVGSVLDWMQKNDADLPL